MKGKNQKGQVRAMHMKAKQGLHKNGLDFVENGEKKHYAGKFFVTKSGQIINLNRNSNIYGHDITSRHYDSTHGVSSKIRGHDVNRRIPDLFNRNVRTSKGKLKKLKNSQKVSWDNYE